ncbi:MAG: TIGR00645 family protein [Candidatus Binatia bacterium]
MVNSPVSRSHTRAEKIVERTIFASRWLLAPFYLGLSVCLVVLLIKFGQKMVKLVTYSLFSSGNDLIPVVLSLIDLSLIANLLLIVMFSGYENFVSRFELDDQKYKPAWMGHVDFGELKLKLLSSIVAISAVHLLESFMNIDQTSDRELEWSIGIQITLILTGVLLAVMNRISGQARH